MSAGASADWSQWDRLPPGGALSATDPEIGLLASIYEAAFVAQSGDRDEAITLIEAMLGY